jgi:hypothetical protein
VRGEDGAARREKAPPREAVPAGETVPAGEAVPAGEGAPPERDSATPPAAITSSRAPVPAQSTGRLPRFAPVPATAPPGGQGARRDPGILSREK